MWRDCTRCRELPALGQLPSLQRLYLTGLENTTCIGLSFYSSSAGEDDGLGGSGTISRQTYFSALKILSLKSMKKLEEWKGAHEVMDVFLVLEKLYIRDCPQLITIPTPSRFPSLDVLEIRGNCHVLLAEKVLSNITTLSSLELGGGEHVKYLNLVKRPESSFRIHGCDSLPTDMLERLCRFSILQRVELRFFLNITTLRGMSCAACLKKLVVKGCENLRELPEDLYQFQALENLLIWDCPRINSFGLNPKKGQKKSLLKSLKKFAIYGCDGLTSLPAEMFESQSGLLSLERFVLQRCPNLITERFVSIGPFSDATVINAVAIRIITKTMNKML